MQTFSYLEAVRQLLPEGVYHRGLKLFLDGKVRGFKDLILDFWREYEVEGRGTKLESIKIPLFHLALDRKKYAEAPQAIFQSTSCSCDYFLEFGVCKHIVAVCAHLENEFGIDLKTKKEELHQQQTATVLDTIFTAENEKILRTFHQQFLEYTIKFRPRFTEWFEKIVHQVDHEPQIRERFILEFNNEMQQLIADYDKEKMVLPLIRTSLMYGEAWWWDFWHELFAKFSEQRLTEIVFILWELHVMHLDRNYQDSMKAYLRTLDSTLLEKVFEQIQKEYPESPDIWIEYVLEARLWKWVSAHLQEFDPDLLIYISSLWPDFREDIEQVLFQKVKIWIDFLQTGQDEEFVQLLNKWSAELGHSQYYLDVIQYFKDVHPRKKGVLKKLQ